MPNTQCLQCLVRPYGTAKHLECFKMRHTLSSCKVRQGVQTLVRYYRLSWVMSPLPKTCLVWPVLTFDSQLVQQQFSSKVVVHDYCEQGQCIWPLVRIDNFNFHMIHRMHLLKHHSNRRLQLRTDVDWAKEMNQKSAPAFLWHFTAFCEAVKS